MGNSKNRIANIAIKKVTLSNLNELQLIGRQTFYETFSTGNTEEDMRKYLNESFSADKLTSELNDKNTEFYFAIQNKIVIGYLKLNLGQSQTEFKENKALEIERIYVARAFQGKAVGQLLYEKAIEIARNHDAEYIWLGVWEQNPKAINFYKKNDFVEFDKHIFKLGNDNQTDIMMKVMLKN